MKQHVILVIIIGFLSTNHAEAIGYYNEGDTLYVWAQSGLILRKSPDFKGEKITALSFATSVITKWHKGEYDSKSSVEAIVPCVYDGQNYPGYKILGEWVQVTANGETGYVFDGYLSKYPCFNNKEQEEREFDSYLTRVFGKAFNRVEMNQSLHNRKFDCDFYKNGASIQSKGIGDGVFMTTYILPGLSLEEGYLIANYWHKLEKHTNNAINISILNPENYYFFLKETSPYLLDFSANNSSMPESVSVGCVNGIVVITTMYAC